MGVFATRSPFRPNRLGLSSVRLLRIEETKEEGCTLVVLGADLLDGTPIYDIKPYLSFSDSHPAAVNGFADEVRGHELEVVADEAVRKGVDFALWQEIQEILRQDPRPGYHHEPDRIYTMDYAHARVRFRVLDSTLYVLSIILNVGNYRQT